MYWHIYLLYDSVLQIVENDSIKQIICLSYINMADDNLLTIKGRTPGKPW